MRQTIIFITILLISITFANGAARKTTVNLALGDRTVKVNIYENAGANVTFFAPHYNEQNARTLAREYVERLGGRLIEIESFDEKGSAARYLKFKLNNKTYTIDPNRIYTENGRACGANPEIIDAVKTFADSILKIVFAADGKTLREGEQFVVAVHNNSDVDQKLEAAKSNDLTAVAFVKNTNSLFPAHGAFEEQADGVFLSNNETDADNFVFLSTTGYIGYFAEKGFNVVVQKAANKLQTKQCALDDGSLSVYSAQNALTYICLEADGASGTFRQRQMLEAVYALLPQQTQTEQTAVAARK